MNAPSDRAEGQDSIEGSPALACVPGSSPKVLTTLIDGMYLSLGSQGAVRHATCLDILNQVEGYVERKQRDAAAGMQPLSRTQVVAAITRKSAKWKLTEAEVTWLLARIAISGQPPSDVATSAASFRFPAGELSPHARVRRLLERKS